MTPAGRRGPHRAPPTPAPRPSEPPLDPTTWGGALTVMTAVVAGLWLVQLGNAADRYGWNRFGLRPRRVDGLWGVLTAPVLHESYGHLISNTMPVLLIGWVLMLSGLRTWLTVTALVTVLGGAAAWLLAPSGVLVGASGVVFGWLGYLLARAYFSRKLKWIGVALLVLFFFGGLLVGLLPTYEGGASWQAHACGFGAGILAGALLHPRRAGARPAPPPAVS